MKRDDNPYAPPQAFETRQVFPSDYDERCERIAHAVKRSDLFAAAVGVYAGLYGLMMVIAGVAVISIGGFGSIAFITALVVFILVSVATWQLFSVSRRFRLFQAQPSIGELERLIVSHTRFFAFSSVVMGMWIFFMLLGFAMRWYVG